MAEANDPLPYGSDEVSTPGPKQSGTVRYWASARAAVGIEEETLAAGSLAEALSIVAQRHADRAALADVLKVSSFVVDGQPVGRRAHAEVRLGDGWVVEVLPPFAGG